MLETQTLCVRCRVHGIAGGIGRLGGAQRWRRRTKSLQILQWMAHLPPVSPDVAPGELASPRDRAILARSREPNGRRRLLYAQKEHEFPEANCGQNRRRL